MLDCGGQGSFINDKLSQNYQLPHESKQFPVSLVLADGSSSRAGTITEYNPILLRTATNEEPFCLDIAPISYDLILGMPWLRLHNPAVRFGSNLMLFDSPYCKENRSHYGKRGPQVSLMEAHAFAMACNHPEAQLFSMSFAPTSAELASTSLATEPALDLSLIPPKYDEFADLFSETDAKKLPPHRPYNHQIPLEPGTAPSFGTIYSLSPTELETLRK